MQHQLLYFGADGTWLKTEMCITKTWTVWWPSKRALLLGPDGWSPTLIFPRLESFSKGFLQSIPCKFLSNPMLCYLFSFPCQGYKMGVPSWALPRPKHQCGPKNTEAQPKFCPFNQISFPIFSHGFLIILDFGILFLWLKNYQQGKGLEPEGINLLGADSAHQWEHIPSWCPPCCWSGERSAEKHEKASLFAWCDHTFPA